MTELEKRIAQLRNEMEEFEKEMTPIWEWLKEYEPVYLKKLQKHRLLRAQHLKLGFELRTAEAKLQTIFELRKLGKGLSKYEREAVLKELKLKSNKETGDEA